METERQLGIGFALTTFNMTQHWNDKQLHLSEVQSDITIATGQTSKNLPSAFIEQAISPDHVWGTPEKCPLNHKLNHFQTHIASISSSTTYGGPASKYKTINEDSYFYGVSQSLQLFSGVVDGAGGSKHGYLGGKTANTSLSEVLHHWSNVERAFEDADRQVLRHAEGGYATGVAITMDQTGFVTLAAKGDARALTLRNNEILQEGTTRIQSLVARKIENGELPPHSIHTAKGKNIIYSVIGNKAMPLYRTEFQAQRGDQIVLASDGLWDIVSDYEIQCLGSKLRGLQLQSSLFMLAYERNNSESGFDLEFTLNQFHSIQPFLLENGKCRGDNITIQVIEVL